MVEQAADLHIYQDTRGCNAIDVNGNHTNQPNHYLGYVFQNGVMLSGEKSMKNPRASGNIVGNDNNGYIKITLIKY